MTGRYISGTPFTRRTMLRAIAYSSRLIVTLLLVTSQRGVGCTHVVNPPRVMHYTYFPEATEVQLTGQGPWEVHTGSSTAD